MSVEVLESSARALGASRKGVRPWRFVAMALAGAWLAASAGSARAALDEEDPQGVRLLAAQHPQSFELLLAGERAAGPTLALASFERAAAEAPESPLPERKRCGALLALGRRADAINACNQAVFKGAVPINFRAAVGALLSGKPDARELATAQSFAERSRTLSPKGLWSAAAACDVALQIGDGALARECIAQLRELAPNHVETRNALARAGVPAAARRIAIGWALVLVFGAASAWQRVRRKPASG